MVALLAAADAAASDTLGVDFTGGSAFAPQADFSTGWEFTVNSEIIVDGLGFWDEGADGLVNSHEIGLWTADCSSLLASVTLTSGTPHPSMASGGEWLFADVPALLLPTGAYRIAATVENGDADVARLFVTVVEPTSSVSYGGHRENVSSSLVCPTQTPAGEGFGPNFRITSAAPVPSSSLSLRIGLAFLIWGLATLLIQRRR